VFAGAADIVTDEGNRAYQLVRIEGVLGINTGQLLTDVLPVRVLTNTYC